MPDFTNIVTVDLTEATGYNVEAHKAVHQWDSGVILQLTGATFPQGTTCQFDTKTTTFNQELTDGACEIPNALLGYDMIGDIKAHVKIDDDDYGIVVYDIHIPVIRRPKPDSYIYTDNSSSSNGWIKSRYGYRVNEDQTILGRTELSINDNQTILDGTSLSLNNQQTVLDGTHLSLASGLFYADSAGITFASGAFQAEGDRLRLNSGRITLGPNCIRVDNRWFGSVNLIDPRKLENGGLNTSNGEDQWYTPIHVRTGYIKVDGNTLYTCSKDITTIQLRMRWVCYYDANLRFISYIAPGADAQSYTFTTPVNTAYLRIGFQRISGGSGVDVTVDTFTWAQLEKGSTLSDPVTHSLDCAELTNRCLQDFPSGNLYDWDRYPMQQGGINSDASGTEFNSDARVRTDYIPCTQRTTYTFSVSKNAAVSAVRLYTAKGTLSTSITSATASSSLTFTTPDSIIYMRFVMVNITGSSNNITASSVKNPTLTIGKDVVPYKPFAETNAELSSRTRGIAQATNTEALLLGYPRAEYDIVPYNNVYSGIQTMRYTKTFIPFTSYTTFTDFVGVLVGIRGGANGSIPIGPSYTANGLAIPQGWYEYMWIPYTAGGPGIEGVLQLWGRGDSLPDRDFTIKISGSGNNWSIKRYWCSGNYSAAITSASGTGITIKDAICIPIGYGVLYLDVWFVANQNYSVDQPLIYIPDIASSRDIYVTGSDGTTTALYRFTNHVTAGGMIRNAIAIGNGFNGHIVTTYKTKHPSYWYAP